jgi:hypothetical protein
MKLKVISVLLFGLSVGFFALGCGGGSPSVDFGDQSTGNLVWGTYHYGFVDKDHDKALAFADKALELHGAEARSMQASLSEFPATDPPEDTFKYKALNDVAAVVLAKGEILLEKGDHEGAREAFTMVVEDFGYAQVQDLGEWGEFAPGVARDARGFMKVAELAKMRLAELEAGQG